MLSRSSSDAMLDRDGTTLSAEVACNRHDASCLRSLQKPRHYPQQLAPTLSHNKPRTLQQEFGLLNKLEYHLCPVTGTQHPRRVVDADDAHGLPNRIDVTHRLQVMSAPLDNRGLGTLPDIWAELLSCGCKRGFSFSSYRQGA